MVCPPSLGALESRESADAYIVIGTQFLFFLPLISTISFLKPMDKGPGKVGPCCLRPEICNKTTNFFLFLYRNFQKIVFNSNYNRLVIKM